jgi:hypothetical protein
MRHLILRYFSSYCANIYSFEKNVKLEEKGVNKSVLRTNRGAVCHVGSELS